MKIPFEVVPLLGGHVNFLLCGGEGGGHLRDSPTQSTLKELYMQLLHVEAKACVEWS